MRAIAILGCSLLLATVAEAVAPKPGDIIVSDEDGSDLCGRLVAIDPSTGDRTIVSSETVGSGPCALTKQGFKPLLTVDDNGRIFWAGNLGQILYLVDPTSGDRTVVSSNDFSSDCIGSGDPFACCTGSGTGDAATPPCVPSNGPLVGAGSEMAVMPIHVPSVSALPPWGLALLVGVLIGVTLRTRHPLRNPTT